MKFVLNDLQTFKGSQYIITNAFTKKTKRTPENEKQIARNRRSQYLNKEENQ